MTNNDPEYPCDDVCLDVLRDFPDQVAVYRRGGTALGFLVGQVLRRTKGRAHQGYVAATLRAYMDGTETAPSI